MPGPVRYLEDFEVGRVYPIGSARFEEADILAYARKFDPQPFHVDREAAAASMHGGLVASGWHVCSVLMRLLVENFGNPRTSLGGAGVRDIRWIKPVRPGDRLDASVRMLEVKASTSRPDMGLIFKRFEAVNQAGELVATMEGREFIRRRPATEGVATMEKRAVKGIDHAVVVVKDIGKALATWKRLGFQVQPRGFHTRLGTANHLMIFGDNYLELIGIVTPNDFNAERRTWLEKGGGLANAALRTDGADLAHAAWTEAGLQPDAILEFGRDVDVAGRKEQASFRTVRLGTKRAKLLGYFACEHRTPQFVYRPEWAKHPNGVTGLAGAVVIASDPYLDEDYVGRVFGAANVKRADGGLLVESGGTPIRYMNRAAFERRYPGLKPARNDDHPALLSFAVAEPMAVAALFMGNGTRHTILGDGRVLVGPEAADGVCIEFAKG